MTLTMMRARGEEEWICDLAETYGIYDWTKFKPSYIATLSNGLRDDSRIKLKLVGLKVSMRDLILAKTADNLTLLLGALSKNSEEPRLFAEIFIKKQAEENIGFANVEDFEMAINKIIGKEG